MTSFKQMILNSKLATEIEIKGLTEAEIINLEKSQNVTLPKVYKQFMLECGKKAGKFMADTGFFYPETKHFKKELYDTLEEIKEEQNITITLPDNIFVLWAHQGYSYTYFICNGEEDPKVYHIMDGGDPPVLVSDSITAYLEEEIMTYAKYVLENLL